MAEAKNIQEFEMTSFPFQASPERIQSIHANSQKVLIGMLVEDVVGVLGEPDEVRWLFEPKVKNPIRIGYTYWYVLERKAKMGNEQDRQDSYMRLSFNHADRVTDVYTTFS